MLVALTGGTGYVGAYAVRALLDAGHHPRLLVRSPDRLSRNVGALGVDVTDLDVVSGDVGDDDAVRRLVDGADALIHAAGVVSTIDPAAAAHTMAVNVDGTKRVVGAALTAGCDPVVHVSSTAALFDPARPVMRPDDPPVVDAPDAYRRSKALADAWVREQQDAGAPAVIVYPGGVAGPSAGDAFGEVAEGFVSMLKMGSLVTHAGALTLIDVRDLAQVLVAILEPGRGPRRFMTAGPFVPFDELARVIREVTGRRFPVLPVPGAALRGLGRVTDLVRRRVAFQTVFTADAMAILTRTGPTDDSAVHEDLHVAYRQPRETVADALRSLHAAGRLSAHHVGRVARLP